MFPSSALPELEPSMDIFSAGCILMEIFTDGQPLFSYGELLSFAEGKTNPDLSALPDEFRDLVQSMIRRSPKDRPTAKALLKHAAFNPVFNSYLYRAVKKYKAHGYPKVLKNSQKARLGEREAFPIPGRSSALFFFVFKI